VLIAGALCTDTETGFLYLRARCYDPPAAQFISRDPITSLTGEPYGYADNDPLNGTDPTGLFCIVHNSHGGCVGAGVVKAA
jgi:RHS repeat-associated protein